MADQFETAFADIAYGYLQEKVPNLMQHLVGFEVVDKDDSGTRGLGLFAIKIGDRYLYAPVFFLNGELKPLEMLWLKDKDIFIPLDEEWVAYLLKNKPLVLGEASQERSPRFDNPNLDLFAQPPMTGRQVSASVKSVFNKMAGKYGVDSVTLQKPTTKALEFLSKAGGSVKRAFLTAARKNVAFLNEVARMYDWGQVKKAAAFAPEVQNPVVQMDAKVASFDDPALLRDLTPEQRERMYRGELVFSSPAGVQEKWAELYDTQFQKDLENPSRSGVYQVIGDTGDDVEALVLLAPHASEKYGSKKATVIELSSKRFVRAPVSRVWVKKTSAPNGERQFGTTLDQLEKLLSDRDGGQVGSKYLLLNDGLASSAPFEISRIWTDSQGLKHYRVIFTEGETPYTEDTNSTRAGPNQEPRTDNALGAEQSMGTSTVMTLIPSTSGSGADKVYALGDELMVPKTFKLFKLTNPAEEGGPKFALGSDATIHDQIFNVTKRAEFSGKLGRLGLRHDGMLFTIVHDGVQARSLTKAAAAETLANTFLMRPDQAIAFLKQAEAKPRHNHEIWALQKVSQDEIRSKHISLQKQAGILPQPSKISQGQRFKGQAATQSEQEAKARAGASRSMALRAKQSQMMPLPGGIPDPRIGSDSGVAPGGQQFYQEELMQLPNMYESPRMLGGNENMYTGPSGGPGGPGMGSSPAMDTQLAMQAAEMGQQTIFDHSMLGSLAQISDVGELINQYLPDLEAALDKLGRLLFLYWWHQEQFKESFGITKMKELEDRLRNVFKTFGELVLDLKQKERGRLEIG